MDAVLDPTRRGIGALLRRRYTSEKGRIIKTSEQASERTGVGTNGSRNEQEPERTGAGTNKGRAQSQGRGARSYRGRARGTNAELRRSIAAGSGPAVVSPEVPGGP